MRSTFVAQNCGQVVVQLVGDSTASSSLYTFRTPGATAGLGINHFLYSFYPLQARILFHKVFRFSTEVIGRVVPTIHRPNKGNDKIYIHNYLIQGVEEA